jgi:hypothetical protein
VEENGGGIMMNNREGKYIQNKLYVYIEMPQCNPFVQLICTTFCNTYFGLWFQGFQALLPLRLFMARQYIMTESTWWSKDLYLMVSRKQRWT